MAPGVVLRVHIGQSHRTVHPKLTISQRSAKPKPHSAQSFPIKQDDRLGFTQSQFQFYVPLQILLLIKHLYNQKRGQLTLPAYIMQCQIHILLKVDYNKNSSSLLPFCTSSPRQIFRLHSSLSTLCVISVMSLQYTYLQQRPSV